MFLRIPDTMVMPLLRENDDEVVIYRGRFFSVGEFFWLSFVGVFS